MIGSQAAPKIGHHPGPDGKKPADRVIRRALTCVLSVWAILGSNQ